MRPTPVALIAAALSFCLAQAALAQQTYTSVAGPWWVTIGGKDRGAILLQFSSPSAGAFAVEDLTFTGQPSPSFGFSRSLESFFLLAAGQVLNFDADANIVGELELSDPNDATTVVGTLIIEKGKANSTYTSLGLRGSIDGVAVKLRGIRPPNAFPVLSGRTTTGRLRGKGLKSKAIDLRTTTFGDLGPPAYFFSGAGPVSGEPNTVALTGHILLAPGFKAWGLLEDSDPFAPATVNGSLLLADPNSSVPTLSLAVDTVPNLKVSGQLIEATEPVLSVTPASFDFGSVPLTGSSQHTFAVSNVGGGSATLAGSASFLAPFNVAFTASGDTTYSDLAPGDPPAQVQVSFAPQNPGTQTAQLRFGVTAGVGAQVVTLTGCGGVAGISVDPASTIAFPNTAVGTSATPITVTVTNTGDCTLTGAATLTFATVFRLIPLGSLIPQDSVSYTLSPGANTRFRVLFTPTASGTAVDTLTLTGGGGATLAITGTGTP